MVCEAVDLCLNSTKIPEDLKQGVKDISCAIMEEEDMNEDKIVSSLNAVSTFEHVTPKQMAEEQQKDPTLELIYQLVTVGEKPKTSAIAKIKSKAVRKYPLQFDRLTLKKGVLHQLYIHNDVEFHQMVFPIKYQAQVLQLLHDGQGHQGIERTIALCQEQFYWNTMFQDVTKYVKECPQCQIAKGDYTKPNTILGVIISNNLMDLVYIDFTNVDPSKDSKENILVLTDTITKFSQAFVIPNQKAVTITKILVDKWFYTYGIPACIHSNKGHSFDNEIMSHLYVMYRVEQSTTTPYNPHGNAPTETLNCTLIGLLKSLPKEQKSNWPLHLPLLVFTYNAMLLDTTDYQPYELMFGCKAPTMCNSWLGLANYNDNFLQSKCTWVNQQHELILAVNRWALKRMKMSAEKSVSRAGEKALNIPIGYLVLLRDHPEGQNKIQDNYKNELFVMESQHQDPNVYTIKPLNGKGPMHKVNLWQLFDLQKTQGSDKPSNPAPNTILPTLLVKKPTRGSITPQHTHLYGTRSKTQANTILQSSSEDEPQHPTTLESSLGDTENLGVMGSLINHISTKLWW